MFWPVSLTFGSDGDFGRSWFCGREAIRGARLVANPGCYPTSVQLPLCPLLSAGMVQKEDIIVDAKSGVSGAGAS